VKKVFKEHDRMILKLSDFVNTKINWEDKHKNILLMSKEIGIGLNSMVFFDDSKIEREAMKNFLPEVLTIEVGKNVSNYIDNIEHTGSFDNSNLTKEDLDRTKKYEIQNQAKILEKKFVNKNEFLKSLKMISIIKPVSVVSFDRAVQLTNKTNQFNLTLNRYDPAKFKKLIDKKKSSIALTMQLKDKFGDHGITGLVVLIKKNKKTWEIDTFLLSCRVIGRGVEDAFLNQVIKILKKKDKNCEMLVGYYKKGPKNVLVKDFYKNQNFTKYKNTYLFNILKDRNKTSKFIKTVK
jgi:FkbH-like protein